MINPLIKRRQSFAGILALTAGLPFTVKAQAKDSLDLDKFRNPNRIEPRTTRDWALHAPVNYAEDFVFAEFLEPLKIELEKKTYSKKELLDLVTSKANDAFHKISSKFPYKSGGSSVKQYQVESQFYAANQIMSAVAKLIKQKFGEEQELYEILTDHDVLVNDFLLSSIYYDRFSKSHRSMETIAEDRSMKPEELNLFGKKLSAPKFVDLSHHSYNAVRAYLQRIFPEQCVPCEVSYRDIEDKSFSNLGRTCKDQIFLHLANLKKMARENKNSFHHEKYVTIFNELLHVMFYKEFDKETRAGNDRSLMEKYGTDIYPYGNKDLEELMSDIVSVVYKPDYLVDMLRSPYNMSNAVAVSRVEKLLPNSFKKCNYSDWRTFSKKVIEEDAIIELKKHGIKKPDLLRDFYLPIRRDLMKLGLEVMNGFRELKRKKSKTSFPILIK